MRTNSLPSGDTTSWSRTSRNRQGRDRNVRFRLSGSKVRWTNAERADEKLAETTLRAVRSLVCGRSIEPASRRHTYRRENAAKVIILTFIHPCPTRSDITRPIVRLCNARRVRARKVELRGEGRSCASMFLLFFPPCLIPRSNIQRMNFARSLASLHHVRC